MKPFLIPFESPFNEMRYPVYFCHRIVQYKHHYNWKSITLLTRKLNINGMKDFFHYKNSILSSMNNNENNGTRQLMIIHLFTSTFNCLHPLLSPDSITSAQSHCNKRKSTFSCNKSYN